MSISTKETLQNIIASGKKHFAVTDFSQLSTDDLVYEAPTNIPTSLALDPITDGLEGKLLEAGILPQHRRLILQQASKVVSTYEGLYKKACRHLLFNTTGDNSASIISLNILRRKLEYSYEHRDAVDFYDKALVWHMSTKRMNPHRAEQAPKPFNHTFIPFLEAYLEQNAFPSPADQKIMAQKSGMSNAQIVNWFQNHRSRARKNGREADLKRLPPGQAVNVHLIEEKIRLFDIPEKNDTDSDLADDYFDEAARTLPNMFFNLDELAHSSTSYIPKTYMPISVEPCIIEHVAFGLPSPQSSRPVSNESPQVTDEDLGGMFNDISIQTSTPFATTSKVSTSRKLKPSASKISSAMTASKAKAFKATIRSCFSAAITLTCPRSHPALLPHKKKRASTPPAIAPSTVFEQRRLPVLPYTPPAVLPSWKLPITSTPESVRRKKPTVPSHGGKTHPGSPYPKQTISRMSSASSLASMASDDSQSSFRSTSSNFSASTIESSELSTPAQSPSPDNVKLNDDVRFSDDIFNEYFYHSNPMPENFFFDINVEEPFDKDVSLSVAGFDKSVSLSIAEFETTTLPSFYFFES